MMKKTKSAKKALLSGIALLALTSGVCGIFALNAGNSTPAFADSQTLIEFTASDSTSVGAGSSLVSNVAGNVSSAWKIDLKQSYGGITFNTPIDLSGAKGIQFRMYIHWSPETLTAEDTLFVHRDAITDQAWADSIWAFWKGVDQSDRPVVQDQWVTFTITDKFPLESLSKLSIIPQTAAGRQVYDDAYILIDKITAIKDGDTVNGANVVTEFGADQVSHAGQGWRSDLVCAGDGASHGATTAWKAKVTPGVVSVSFPEVGLNALYGKNLKGLQIRMYAHLGEITGDTNIEVQLNGTTMGHWASEASSLFDTTRPIIQDQWITYTVAENFSLDKLSKLGFNFPASGIKYHQDAYILVDKITTIEDSAPMGENVVTEFAADQISQSGKGWRTDLINDVDTNNDGKVDAKNAWRVNLDTGVASTGITFANAIDLSAYAGIQFRVFVHWGTNFGAESKISFCANTAKPGNEYDGVFALWKGKDQADRPMKQDEWITFTVAENLPTTSLSALGIYIIPDGVTAYDDAYILIDKIVGIPKTAETHGENVITEFAANEVSHGGQGWRTDLVTEMDESNQGATNAFRFDPHYSNITFGLAKGYDMTGVKALQFRMYMHLGENLTYAGNGPVINMYANGTNHIVNWNNNSTYRQFVQDQWITFTVTNGLSDFGGTFNKLKLEFNKGDTVLYDDAYILIDNITAVKETTNGEGVLTDFAFGQITHADLGWCSDFASNVDTDGDGKVDAENAYRLNCSYRGGDYPSLVFTDPISLSGVKTFHLRMFVHWGEISSEGAGMMVKVKTASGEKDLIYMWSDDKLKQDQWLDFYLKPDEVAKLGDSITGIVVQKMNSAKVSQYDDAYILFDKIYENKYTVTFNHGEGLGTEKVEVSEGLTVTAPECKKAGHTVKWYYMNGEEKVYYNASAAVDSDVTYLAEYTLNTYTVTFDHPEGYQDKQVKVDWNGKVSADASQAACQDVGKNVVWYSDSEYNNVFDFNTAITADTTIYAKYVTNVYTVTFDHGTNGTSNQNVEHGGKASAQASLNVAYTVTWYTDAEFTTPYDFNNEVTGALTLYGKYVIKTFNVTFVHGNGIDNEVVENVEYGSKTEAKASKKTGYTVEWYADETLETVFNFATTEIKAVTTIYAKYTPIEYTVTYMDGQNVVTTKPVNYDATAPEEASTKTGYTVKWYTDAECTNEYNFATPITGNLTLYAKYTIETYTITFNHEDGAVNVTVDYDNKVAAAASTKPGHSVKWYYMNGETKVYFDFDAGVTADYVLQPEYKINTYTVTIDHGKFGTQTVSATYGTKIAEPDSKDETYNVEWYADAEFTTPFDFETAISGNTTVYGKYVIKTYTVTFVHGDSIANEVVENVEHGAKVEAKAGKKDGYSVKWYADEEHTTEFDFANDTITEDTTIYAVYTINTYTVTVVLGGDAADLKLTVNHGAKADLSGAEKEGYTVALYTDEAMTTEFTADTPITGNITLYAKYTQIKKSGCGGELGFGNAMLSTAVAGVVIAGALVLRKKKEND